MYHVVRGEVSRPRIKKGLENFVAALWLCEITFQHNFQTNFRITLLGEIDYSDCNREITPIFETYLDKDTTNYSVTRISTWYNEEDYRGSRVSTRLV